MERTVGTITRGLRCPIINEGDNIEAIVVDSVLNASKAEGFSIEDKDIVAVTESIVARAQGNYASIDQIAKDVTNKFGETTIGVIFPIFSRNRFSNCLRGIARGAKKVVLMMSYPSDEVGNHIVSLDKLDEKGVNPWTDVLDEKQFRELFGYNKHTFTGVDYIEYYKELIAGEGAECEVIFSQKPKTILDYTKNVLTCDIHTRYRTKRILENNGAEKVFTLDDILSESVDGSGFNENYGLLGSNKSTEEAVKLFPRECQPVVEKIQDMLKEKTGKTVEVMVYGDGAFKDPVGKIWELADPVVSPAFTSGLEGTPNEVKLKYLADNNFSDLRGADLEAAIKKHIDEKEADLTGSMEAQGTTPRQLTDLIGSLADLTSGSGDKGTPIVFIQGYFDNFTK
ncbi:coenzyme F420-0:L-glutamate ligase [Vagococcus carniphilus]|uniref:coenzyme F420-0:L-glutamate ligase n=1 Tax=Vagococcus carniphilus TaxID=218144 RepID=UPI0028902F92|nr:coenzyme F420-0:L-glutamate ligase [Vagococcus carniphilus]MDT2814265.1 coenzyme F420-0:L-glutamate ligase [Vagococcus carniphilus]MDT2829383.1 coenzyme F420-0:L-glutamate ligase [Vagococcus carniphilus]MDT2838842.1 coenzyme F420-0:L-glutamate ligase [Vagococcus carniphilus]MDT2852900.1 coenzyme F420-0:L-glutamate ligase [Vagococcus carniphilus]MDT2864453.1 coenzyme F420-0:L-glutamate ligase [Vagococcus carniphilus]